MGTRAAAFVALLGLSQRAAAHGSVAGLGNFFSGVLHPLLEPAQLIALVGLGLFLGQRGLAGTRPAVPLFLLGTTLGLVAAGCGFAPATDAPLLVAAALCGLAVAAATPLPAALCAAVAGLVGLGVGFGSAPEAVAGSARLTLLLGSGVGLCVWMFNVLGLVHEVRRAWLLVLVRVVGSWITASAVLVMALWFAGKPPETAAALARAAARSGATTLTLDTAR